MVGKGKDLDVLVFLRRHRFLVFLSHLEYLWALKKVK